MNHGEHIHGPQRPAANQFVGTDGKRRSIRLGKVPMKTAATIKARVETFWRRRWAGMPSTAIRPAWLGDLDSKLYDKLAAVGLVPRREPRPDEPQPEGRPWPDSSNSTLRPGRG